MREREGGKYRVADRQAVKERGWRVGKRDRLPVKKVTKQPPGTVLAHS